MIKKFGNFNAIELSLIATAFYLKDNFGVTDTNLVTVVHQVKQNHSVEYIKNVLQKGGILPNT